MRVALLVGPRGQEDSVGSMAVSLRILGHPLTSNSTYGVLKYTLDMKYVLDINTRLPTSMRVGENVV